MSRPSAAGQRLDIEWLAMKAGIKPANRVSIDPDRAAEVEARARREGWAVARAPQVVEFPGRAPSLILYLAADAAYARAVAEAEARLLPPMNAHLGLDEEVPLHTELGRLLGFPPCCVEEFCTRLRRGITCRVDGGVAHEDFVAAECAVRRSAAFLGRLNDLSPDRRARIVTFYPCRYDCPRAADYAGAVFAAAERFSPVAAAELRTALLGTFSIGVDGVRGAADDLQGDRLTVEFENF